VIDSKLAEKILGHIKEDEIVAMACDVINIPSPTGEELGMATYMRRTFEEMGLTVSWQEVEEGRANVVGRLEGRGGGKSLMFNGHMDTSNTGRGIYNMKGALVCYTHAVKALQAAGLELNGDVLIAAVVGEIEKTQWGDEFIGKQYRGYGVGSHYLVNHGVVPDMCILGEPTDLQLVLGHYGSLWARISTHGAYRHTGFTMGRQGENAINRMYEVLGEVLQWSAEWERKATYGDKPGVVNLGCIRGGHPWRASRTPERADLFLDVRVPPTMPLSDARREVQGLVVQLREKHPDYGIEFETFVSVPGAEISGDHEMIKAIEACHQQVLGSAPQHGTVVWSSDASVLTRYGIETVNYGPSSGPRDAEGEKVRIQALVDVTKIYALAAAQLCGAR
jgi:acetylornithine deacetylase